MKTVSYCGPATPSSPFESPGLGSSDFARHYFRNHGCFLFLQVLRWFTSLSSLDQPMYSAERNWCSYQLGSPIRTSPDHRLLASPRGFSQLATSFFAYLRQGIHTHALSSLTIKLTPISQSSFYSFMYLLALPCRRSRLSPTIPAGSNLLLCTAPLRSSPKRCPFIHCTVPVRYSIVKDRRKLSAFSNQLSAVNG